MQCWLEDLVVEQAKVTTVAALTSFGFQASTIYQGRNYSVNWGGGGCIFMYSRSARRISFRRTEREYMNIHPPPFSTNDTKYSWNDIQLGVSKKGNRTLMCYRAFKISTCVAETTRLLAFVCHRYCKIYNGNCTEWSAIWSEIKRVITKSHDREAGVRFVITSLISDRISDGF